MSVDQLVKRKPPLRPAASSRHQRNMRHRLGLSVTGLVGFWICIFYRLAKNDQQEGSANRLRGDKKFASPTTRVSQPVDRSQRRSVETETHKIAPKKEDYRGQEKATRRSNNNDCQSIVDDFGNVVSTAAGSLLSVGEPVFGAVSGGSYVYYKVGYR